MDDVQHQWDTTCCGSQPGGIWWDSAHSQKATASNGGPIIANVMLYQLTQNSSYLDFAVKVYDYWSSTMVNTQTHEVADHIDTHGVITYWQFTYNNGLMVGAGAFLFC